ncbi:MAG: hypothetical protein H6696_01795 [Deferribacteres bacterium]|nr:hypothetical protein [candidate division KSB1 bacterium]MCB9500644.1 hypothetical protein [Deferribacteres bacterium]
MPIEIRELVIRAVVEDPAENKSPRGESETADTQEGIIAECVEQVMLLLREKEER